MSSWLPRGRVEWSAAIVAVVALVAFGWLARQSPQQGMLSYLFAFVFFTGLSVGALALVMVHTLTGGAWGEALRPQWIGRGPHLAATADIRVAASHADSCAVFLGPRGRAGAGSAPEGAGLVSECAVLRREDGLLFRSVARPAAVHGPREPDGAHRSPPSV